MKHQRKFVGCRIASGVDPIIVWLGKYLERERLATEWVGEKAGMPGGVIRHWINGRRNPNLAGVRAVLNAVGYDLKIVRLK